MAIYDYYFKFHSYAKHTYSSEIRLWHTKNVTHIFLYKAYYTSARYNIYGTWWLANEDQTFSHRALCLSPLPYMTRIFSRLIRRLHPRVAWNSSLVSRCDGPRFDCNMCDSCTMLVVALVISSISLSSSRAMLSPLTNWRLIPFLSLPTPTSFSVSLRLFFAIGSVNVFWGRRWKRWLSSPSILSSACTLIKKHW